jgi:hypothetical protein
MPGSDIKVQRLALSPLSAEAVASLGHSRSGKPGNVAPVLSLFSFVHRLSPDQTCQYPLRQGLGY